MLTIFVDWDMTEDSTKLWALKSSCNEVLYCFSLLRVERSLGTRNMCRCTFHTTIFNSLSLLIALGHEFMKSKCRLVLAARSIDKLKRIKEEMVEIYKV